MEVKAPDTPIPRTSGDCDQTWCERGTNGYAAFGIFKMLWQTHG